MHVLCGLIWQGFGLIRCPMLAKACVALSFGRDSNRHVAFCVNNVDAGLPA